MRKRNFICLFLLVISLLFMFEGRAWSGPRDDVVAHAYEVLNYEWETSGYILLHYSGYEYNTTSNYAPTLFNANRPLVATGKLKGIPYSLSANGNGRECTMSEYKQLTDAQKQEVSNVYRYGWNGNEEDPVYYWRVSAKYGMSCATFVWDCISQVLPIQRTASSPSIPSLWSNYLSKTSYSSLEKGDILQKSAHVMLVVDNDFDTNRNFNSNRLTVIEQSPPDLISITNNGGINLSPHGYFNDSGLCNTNIVGTRLKTYYYSEISSYTAYKVDYVDDDDDLPWTGSPGLKSLNFNLYAKTYTLENKTYDVYSDKYLTNRLTGNWTDGTEEDYITGVGKNKNGIDYARVSIPIDNGGRKSVYVNLHDVFVQGSLNGAARTATNSKQGLYRRINSGYDSSYAIDSGDPVYLLTKTNGWCQVLYPISGSMWQIAWLTESDYNGLFPSVVVTPPTITTSDSSFKMVAGQYFSKKLEATNNPTSWSILSGNLPSGLTLDKSGGIKGTPDYTVEGKTAKYPLSYTIEVIASNKGGASAAKKFDIVFYEPPVITNDKVLSNGYIGESYNEELYATGSAAGMLWELKSGSLPPGLKLETSTYNGTVIAPRTANITGTPTSSGTYTFTIGLKAGMEVCIELPPLAGMSTSKQFTIKVTKKPPVIADNDNLKAVTGVYEDGNNNKLTASGATSVTWRITNGSLPPGLTLNSSTGKITGTPASTEAGKQSHTSLYYHFTVVAKDNESGLDSEPKEFSFRIYEAPIITTNKVLSDGYVGKNYSAELYATGMQMGMYWKLISGSLPDGLTIQKQSSNLSGYRTTTISGTPTKIGTFSFTVQVAAGPEVCVGLYPPTGMSVTKEFQITVKGSPSITTTSPLPDGTVGVSYTKQLEATGTTPITWSIYSGSLHSGLSLGSSTGKISGTPTTAGTYSFTVKAANSVGSTTKEFKITINGIAPTITTTSPLPDGTVGTSYNYTLSATGTTPITWSKDSGSLPPGLSQSFYIESSTGKISGTPATAGTYTFTVKASNSAGSYTKTFKLTINEAPSISIENVSPGKFVGDYYEAKINANFSILSCTISSGSLPANLTLKKVNDSQWSISGYLTKAGVFSFSLKVMSSTESLTKTFSMTVEESGIKIDSENFPDSKFRSYVSDNFDKDKNGYLSDEELAAVKNIDVDGNGISSLEGIEYFTELTSLSCNSNNIKELDLSDNTKLKYLYCNSNALTELILGNNSELKHVDCQNNPKLYEVNVTGCPNLTNIQRDPQTKIEPEPEPEIEPEFTVHSLLLSGQIGVKFYTALHEDQGLNYTPENCWMEFDINGDTTSNNPQTFDWETFDASTGYHHFICYINSVQMADPITATLYYGNNKTVTHNYSVLEYLDTAIERSKSAAMRELASAIKDYGYYMQVYLARYNNWKLGEKHIAMEPAYDYNDDDIAEAKNIVSNYAIIRDTGQSEIAKVTFTLTLDSNTTINLFLEPKSSYTGSVSATFEGSNENLAVKMANGTYKVEIAGISAHKLGDTYTVTVNAGKNFNVKVSALSYVNAVLNSSSAAYDLKQAVTSLYRYYAASMAYKNSIGQ